MGGTTFTTDTIPGTDVERAFNDTRAEAQHEYGHGGYTGTIAEKNDYVIIRREPLPPAEAETLAERLLREDDERISDKWGPAGAIPIAIRPTRAERAAIPPGWYDSDRDATTAALGSLTLAAGETAVVPPRPLAGVQRYRASTPMGGKRNRFHVGADQSFEVTVEYGEPRHSGWLFFGWASC
jgi:hypothetical protein